MSRERENTGKTTPKRTRRVAALILAGKFFPRKFFIDNWGILVTFVVLSLASIAHRNMFLLQLNKIKKLETVLADRTTTRTLLQYEQEENLRLHEIDMALERYDLNLIHSPEPQKEIVVPNKPEVENVRE